MLADIYIPSTLSLASLTNPSQSQLEENLDDDDDDDGDSDDSDDSGDSISRDRRYSLVNAAKEDSLNVSVSVKTLCRPEKRNPNYSKIPFHDETLSGTIEIRCIAALKHIEEGLECLLCANEESSGRESRDERIKEDVQNVAKSFQPIPLHYESLKSHNDNLKNKTGNQTSSKPHVNDSNKMPVTSSNRCGPKGSWQSLFVEPLLRKASVAAYAMAQCISESKIGESFKYLQLSLVCYGECLNMSNN